MTEALHGIALKLINGELTTLAAFRGKVLLVVNVASHCGLTPQYAGLEALYEAKRGQGLEILAFPCNDFAGQEPGSEAEIVRFCSTHYRVQFPLFSKITVKGEGAHPLYRMLTAARAEAVGEGSMRARLKEYGIDLGRPGEVLWNFEKFLVGRNGTVVERFAPDVTAEDTRLASAVERELGSAR